MRWVVGPTVVSPRTPTRQTKELRCFVNTNGGTSTEGEIPSVPEARSQVGGTRGRGCGTVTIALGLTHHARMTQVPTAPHILSPKRERGGARPPGHPKVTPEWVGVAHIGRGMRVQTPTPHMRLSNRCGLLSLQSVERERLCCFCRPLFTPAVSAADGQGHLLTC